MSTGQVTNKAVTWPVDRFTTKLHVSKRGVFYYHVHQSRRQPLSAYVPSQGTSRYLVFYTHMHARAKRARAHAHAFLYLLYLLFVVVVVVEDVEMLNSINFFPWNDILWLILMLIILWITC